jgi:DNA polymerase III sliding clamp (beta) subunit (PCNA family)
MNCQREQFLNDLEMVRAGLSPREFIEQSSCFVFQDGEVMTFNDEVACRKEVGVKIKGAVQAAALLDILSKLDDEELTIEQNGDGELEFRGKRKSFGVTMEKEIFLPIDKVERPGKWRPLPKEFTEAIGLVQHCVSTDESKFLLTCVHLKPDCIEACDDFQAMRCLVDTGVDEPTLIRGKSINEITSLAMDKVSVTKSWIHFHNQTGLIYSCRRYNEDYYDLNPILKNNGHPIVIPKGLAKASERASVFAVDPSGISQVTVRVKSGKVMVQGEGATGWYRELSKVVYDGPPLEFVISPVLLKQISENYSDATISDTKLSVSSGKHWKYCTVLSPPKSKDEVPAPESEDNEREE